MLSITRGQPRDTMTRYCARVQHNDTAEGYIIQQRISYTSHKKLWFRKKKKNYARQSGGSRKCR